MGPIVACVPSGLNLIPPPRNKIKYKEYPSFLQPLHSVIPRIPNFTSSTKSWSLYDIMYV
jgi:hypothetical protein